MNQPQRPDPLAILKEWQTQLEKFSTESFNIEEFGENIAQVMSQMVPKLKSFLCLCSML